MENADSVRVKECATRLFLFLITVFGQCQNRRRRSEERRVGKECRP